MVTCVLCGQGKFHAWVEIEGKVVCLESLLRAIYVARDIGLLDFYDLLKKYRADTRRST